MADEINNLIPEDLQDSQKVELLTIGQRLLVATLVDLKAKGFGDVAIGGVAQGLGAAVAGAFHAYGLADAASLSSGKQDRRDSRVKARMARIAERRKK